MLPLAIAFLAAGVFVLKYRRPLRRPHESRQYRIDARAISTVLFLLSGCMLVLDFATRLKGMSA